jgi:chemotaxis protein MotB
MARKKKHEEHQNHEAWAIPYGDLVTLLFALFTVMYAVSSVNDGKFRVLSDSMIAAFNGAPRSTRPIIIGDKEPGKGGDKLLTGIAPKPLIEPTNPNADLDASGRGGSADPPGALSRMQRDVQASMRSLIDAKLVTVQRNHLWLEIEINADVLFPSGSGELSAEAEPVLQQLAQVLKPFSNPIRVEGHTDDRPIKTAAFPSNWELSAARAASVVHRFMQQGIDPQRLEIVGFGEFRPRQPNDTVEGRNANRRVVVLVLDQAAQDASQAPLPAAAQDASQGPLPAAAQDAVEAPLPAAAPAPLTDQPRTPSVLPNPPLKSAPATPNIVNAPP